MKSSDTEILSILKNETLRQKTQLQMIPSENYASAAVREVVGSILINKYSEGQPFKRYYQGMDNVDALESLVEKRALKAFKLDPEKWDVNVQPYSGSPANAEIFMALLEPGQKIMAMYLTDGGHISHGWSFKERPLSFASKFFKIDFYHVDRKTHTFDYEEIATAAKKIKPKILVAGGTAYPREIDHKKMGKIAKSVGAYYLADVSHEAGLIAACVNNSPFDGADVVMMTTHKTLRGPRGAMIFAKKELIEQIDKAVFPGLQGGPHNHTIAGIGVALGETMQPAFKTYAKQIIKNAQALAEELKKRGYDIVTGGTDKHLILIDLRNKGLSGKVPALALEKANIVCNFNTVPYDTAPPLYPSGLRLGTPAITTRGMKEREMKLIAGWIDEVVMSVVSYQLPDNPKLRREFMKEVRVGLSENKTIAKVAKEVAALTKKFPTP
jgi:glycine hydroxymethyltransferase